MVPGTSPCLAFSPDKELLAIASGARVHLMKALSCGGSMGERQRRWASPGNDNDRDGELRPPAQIVKANPMLAVTKWSQFIVWPSPIPSWASLSPTAPPPR